MSDASGRSSAADGVSLRTLAAARSDTRAMSDQLLAHLPDVGDLATSRLLDAWVEQAADTLRALSEAVEERLLALGRAATLDVPREDAPAAYAVDRVTSSRPPVAPDGGSR